MKFCIWADMPLICMYMYIILMWINICNSVLFFEGKNTLFVYCLKSTITAEVIETILVNSVVT